MFALKSSYKKVPYPRRHKGVQSDPPPTSIFLALNFCSLTDYQKLWHNCSLFVKTSFDFNKVTSQLMTSL